jgi:hypothetical protein
VVDTIGLNTKTFVDAYRTPHSDKLHVIEHWKAIDNGNQLEVTMTIDDPDAFNQPWKAMARYRRVQNPYVEEVCAEGNFMLFDYGIPVAAKADF